MHKFLASSLKVLCISCKFPASSLQVLCKFLAKFLAKSLQEFSAGGGKSGKVGPKMASTSIQNGANLAQGGRPGVAENQQQSPKIEKTQTQTQTFVVFVFLGAAISSKNGGLNGWAFTDVL